MSSIQKAKDIVTGYDGPPIRLMEVCGTHTHEIFRHGLRQLLPENIELVSGPGCPVCVTPVSYIDEAIYLALHKKNTICTFGDLLRVPGSSEAEAASLAAARSSGAKIQLVYTPLDAVTYAAAHPGEEVTFLSVGFETTTPGACLAVQEAQKLGLRNLSLLTANKTMPEAYERLAGTCDAYLYPGHVCTITGTKELEKLAERGISGVVAGFTAGELIIALAVLIKHLTERTPFFRNCYTRVVKPEGSPAARRLIAKLMEPCEAEWRGLGIISNSGLQLRPRYAEFDARSKYNLPAFTGQANPACRCGEILSGTCRPTDCPLYGKTCTPEHPIGACMVSREGTCSAYYSYNH